MNAAKIISGRHLLLAGHLLPDARIRLPPPRLLHLFCWTIRREAGVIDLHPDGDGHCGAVAFLKLLRSHVGRWRTGAAALFPGPSSIGTHASRIPPTFAQPPQPSGKPSSMIASISAICFLECLFQSLSNSRVYAYCQDIVIREKRFLSRSYFFTPSGITLSVMPRL